jgi:preprotein translocase subunit SecA
MSVKKKCYTKDVVYGCPGNFQGDLLRHEFELMGTRGDRKYDIVIVDEVDNMLIDDAQHITMLSGRMPGFEYLQNILINCWNLLKIIDSKFINVGQELIWINDDVKNDKTGKILMKKQESYQPECHVHDQKEFTVELLAPILRNSIKDEDKELKQAGKK